MNSNNLQKIKKTVDNLYVEKQKIEKEKSKKGGKGKSKASLRLEEDNVICWPSNYSIEPLTNYEQYFSFTQATIKEYGQYESYDYDDFMWEKNE